MLAHQRRICDQVTEILGCRDEGIARPEICCRDNKFLLEDQMQKDNNHLSWNAYILSDKQVSDDVEMVALQDSLDIAVILATNQEADGKSSPKTLKKRFELAKAIERSGNHEEAEYHCRIILASFPHIEVLTFLGMILVNASRLEDATFLLFRALTEFIIGFSSSSIAVNMAFFKQIEELFTELVLHDDDHAWSFLTSCLIEMMTTIREAISENAIDQIYSRLFLCGFSFAHECTVLGFINSATYIYRILLEFFLDELDVVRYGIEKAKAHQRYALLLRRNNRWTSCTKQLLLAYESIISSGSHGSELIAVLETDCVELIKRLTTHPHGKDSLVKHLREMLTNCRSHNTPQVQEPSATIPGPRVEEYLLSDDLPLQLSALGPSIVSHVAQFGLHFNATEMPPRSRDRTSTENTSNSVSHEYGVTFSAGSGASIVSNSCHFVPGP